MTPYTLFAVLFQNTVANIFVVQYLLASQYTIWGLDAIPRLHQSSTVHCLHDIQRCAGGRARDGWYTKKHFDARP